VCQSKFDLPAYLRRDCGGNSLAKIEGLSAGIVGGWGQEGRGCRDGARGA